jgi:glutathione S-transferase
MITLYSHAGGPNGWKVAIVLEELGLQYETKYMNFNVGEHKQQDYTQYNPNGRIPTIIDHDNGDFVLWESNTIIKYLCETYDKEGKISYNTGKEKYLIDQWLSFQASGQGPYFGQAAWFGNFHSEKIPSAVERYQKEVERVVSVLDSVLAKQKYLVGDKPTIADLVFVSWDQNIPWLMTGSSISLDKYTNFKRWHDEMVARPTVKKVYEIKASLAK